MAYSVQHARLHQPQSNRRSTSAITRARPGPVRPPGGTVTALILALSPATWRARVERQPDGSFDYVVQGWPRNGDAAQAVTVLEGVHVPGANENTGSGHWRYDLTAAHGLDPTTQPGTGAMDVDYSLAGPRTLEVGLTDFQQPGDATTNDTLCRYTEAVDGSGTFDFISNLDIDAENDSTRDRRELLQVRSRLADGPGRADVTATHGDLPAGVQVEVNECWDAAFARTYWHFSFPQSEVSDGDAAACPYAEAEYPEFEGFDANAFADGDLVAALPEPGDLPDTPVGVREPASEPALYFVITRDLIENTNAHVSKTLGDIRALTRLPPNDCTPEGCTWGPWTDWDTRLTSRLEVRRAGEGHFTYQADAKHFGEGDDAWRKLFEGGFSPAEANGDGEGWYADGVSGPDDAEPADTRYSLIVEPDGGGQVSFSLPADIDEGHEGRVAREDLAALTRWAPTGAGQTDVRVTGGDLEAAQVVLGRPAPSDVLRGERHQACSAKTRRTTARRAEESRYVRLMRPSRPRRRRRSEPSVDPRRPAEAPDRGAARAPRRPQSPRGHRVSRRREPSDRGTRAAR